MNVFFDIDDTLYDRGMPFSIAADEFFGGKVQNSRAAYEACSIRSNEVFLPSQRGEISMEDMYIYRWGKGFEDIGIKITAREALDFQKLYDSKKGMIALSPTLEEMLKICVEKADHVGVITNGPSQNQWNKVQRLGLKKYVNKNLIIVSGDVGIDKPDPGIFKLAMERSGGNTGKYLYAGDSVKNDIYPAAACGWNTIWFNKTDQEIPTDLVCSSIVRSEAELAEAVMQQLSCL